MSGESEVQLCARLRAWGEALGFDVYPEVDGWDLVLVSSKQLELDHSLIIEPGQQVGIHAKLRASFEVLEQAVAPGGGMAHPAHPYVAVPRAGRAFKYIARRLGIGVIEVDSPEEAKSNLRGQAVHVQQEPRRQLEEHPQLRLPPVASRCIEAGAPSPRVLSKWRVNALRFLAHARARETVTAADLAAFDLGKSWVERWLVTVDWTTQANHRGKAVRVRTYRLTADAKALPDFGYEDVAAELAAVPAPAVQGAGHTDQRALFEDEKESA